MGKQEFEQGDSNVVVRNQVVYGALPQDVIDRMGDTTLALQTTEQNVLPAINELKSNLTQLLNWTEIGHQTGSTPEVAVDPSQYSEFALFVYNSDYCASANIMASLVVNGRYIDLGGDSTFRIQCTSTGIKLNQFKFNSQSYTSNCTFYVYAR